MLDTSLLLERVAAFLFYHKIKFSESFFASKSMNKSLYHYIKNHIDEDGFYTEPDLPDSGDYPYLSEPGHTDAFYYTMDMPAAVDDASLLLKDLRAYLAEPLQPHRQRLYQDLKSMSMAEYCDPFISSFDADDMNAVALDLARSFFYNARHREPLKFALILFGLYGMERLQKEDPQLWQDIVTLAHCEEFTFSFLYGCRIGNYTPQKAVWELLGCTKGWGKVFAIIDCQCADEAQRLWLLKNGPDIDVEYPPLSVKLMQATNLAQVLQQPVISFTVYKSAMAIIGNYLFMLLHYPPQNVRESHNLHNIDIYPMLCGLLRHAQYLAVIPEDLLDMITIANTLWSLLEENNLYSLSPNQCHELISRCDKMVYCQDWQEQIQQRLIIDGQINYQLADFAYETEVDVWPRLFAHWQQHPLEYTLFPYLLPYEGDDRSQRVLQLITSQLPLYAAELHALVVPLRYLQTHPSQGEAIITAALGSLHELLRGCACDALESWEPQQLTPAIRDALRQTIRTSTDELVKARAAALLQGQKLDLEALMRKLKKLHARQK